MQGINKVRHSHLSEAMLQLERLQSKSGQHLEDLQQTVEHRKQLEEMYEKYNRQLVSLSKQISAYEKLYTKIKTQYLVKQMKQLKKEIPVQEPAFLNLVQNIHIIYGT